MHALGIVGHVRRRALVDELVRKFHPQIVNVDDGTLGVTGNHIAVLEKLRAIYPRHWPVVIEDDAVPVEDLGQQLDMALAAAPGQVLSFYCGGGYPAQYQHEFTEAVMSGACWLKHQTMRHGVAYAVAPELCSGLLATMRELAGKRWATDDAIGAWAKRRQLPVYYSNPSLVDHLDRDQVTDVRFHLGQVTSGRKRPRKAHRVGSRAVWDATVTEVDIHRRRR